MSISSKGEKPKKDQVEYSFNLTIFSNPTNDLEFNCSYELWKFGTFKTDKDIKMMKIDEKKDFKIIYKVTFPIVKRNNSMICYTRNSIGSSDQIEIPIELGNLFNYTCTYFYLHNKFTTFFF